MKVAIPNQGLTGGGGGGGGPPPLPGLPLQIFNAVHFLSGFPSFCKILTLDPPSKFCPCFGREEGGVRGSRNLGGNSALFNLPTTKN